MWSINRFLFPFYILKMRAIIASFHFDENDPVSIGETG
jgi:hypothetical protein